jgi:hypothetical protein
MMDLFIVFWTVMIFGSIAWYGFLIFYIGVRGGREIFALTRTLDERAEASGNAERREGEVEAE